MSEITIKPHGEQARQICFNYIAERLIMMKQYLDESTIRKYKFMLVEFGSLSEIEEVIEQFDKSWPKDITWNSI